MSDVGTQTSPVRPERSRGTSSPSEAGTDSAEGSRLRSNRSLDFAQDERIDLGALLAADSGFTPDPRFAVSLPAAIPADPEHASQRAWDEGHAAGCTQTQHAADALAADQAAARGKLELTLARLDIQQQELLRQRLFTAIEVLCAASLAPLQLDRDALAARVERAAAMLARADDERVLRLNPADIELVGDALPRGLEVRPDPALERGALRLETANGGVEDGPAHWRRAIAEALAQC